MDFQQRIRIGIDVGGTFTDFVASDISSDRYINFKEPSTPGNPSLAVQRGLSALLDANAISPNDISDIVHGTTIALNAIIQRKGASIALVVSRGNRDILEIARARMASPYDMFAQKEEPLVPRNLVLECAARAAPDGSVVAFPDDDEIDALAETIRKSGVSAVAVTLLHSYANPQIERDLVTALKSRLPDILTTASTDLWPEMREYERALIASLNSYVHPIMETYLAQLRDRLDGLGTGASLYITASNGGSLAVETARQRPIDTILSGPVSGVVAAAHLSKQARQGSVITIDMGGTSADMSICEYGDPETTTLTYVGDFPIVMPVVDVSAIGAGGGSVIWIDEEGLLKVGPESAGADPGPVCYDKGGTRPTITDCYLVIGFLSETRFLGGRMRLNRKRAVQALDAIAEALGMTGEARAERAAEAALQVATARMATELFKGLAKRGADPRGFALLPFGGAGPTHANLLAEEARLDPIIVPPAPGLFCALGALVADVKRDFVRSLTRPVEAATAPLFFRLLQDLETEATAWLDGEGDVIEARSIARSADMRYIGQAYELNVALPEALDANDDLDAVLALFHEAHARVYGFADAAAPVEFHNLRTTAIGRVQKPSLKKAAGLDGDPPPSQTQQVWLNGAWQDVPVYARQAVSGEAVIPGPALVDQPDTTIVILPGWQANSDNTGSLQISRAART